MTDTKLKVKDLNESEQKLILDDFIIRPRIRRRQCYKQMNPKINLQV